MNINRFMNYSRYILAIVTLLYILLVWMYFKDNTAQLNASSLLIWFLLIPALLIGTIVAIRWWLKKQRHNDAEQTTATPTKEQTSLPETYKIFIYSSLNLPEGNEWSEIIENKQDLTMLDEELLDFDGLPILTKPITQVTTEPWLLDEISSAAINNEDDADFSSYEHTEAPNDLTLRLGALIKEQLQLSADILTIIAEHFAKLAHDKQTEPNAALDIHPEWQQQYIVSSDSRDDAQDHAALIDKAQIEAIKLSIHLCLPENADSRLLSQLLKQQLQAYGLPEALLEITLIISDTVETTNTDPIGTDAPRETQSPLHFIDEHIIALAKAQTPEVCLLVIADSQLNEDWLESHYYDSENARLIPTEASTLLVFCNQSSQGILDTDTLNPDNEILFSLAKIDSTPTDSRHHYANNIKRIKSLFFNSAFNHRLESTSPEPESKRALITPKSSSSDEPDLSDKDVTILSDINLQKSPYDIAVLNTFIDAISDKGALVNEHYLGHYMPLNTWLTSFLSLAILADTGYNNKQPSDIVALITQHNRCSLLWLADFY